ncbi:MAG: hypothetical protein ACXAD7_11370 [Candidatus Kariarchaeaceae archaeon]
MQDEADTGEESLGTILAYSVGVPVSVLFVTFALGYMTKDHRYLQNKTHPVYWPFWFIGSIFLFTIAAIVWALVGVGWFLFETAILALLLQSTIIKLHHHLPQFIKRNKFLTLIFTNVFFIVLTIFLFVKRQEIEASLDSDRVFIEIMFSTLFVMIFTVWVYYIHWNRSSSPHSAELQEMLPLMFTVGMLIMYFETAKGLFKESQISWVEFTSVQLDFFTTIVLFFAAIVNVTQDIVQHIDLDISAPKLNIGFLSRFQPYSLVLWVYILYSSKYFYSDLVGISIPFLYGAIVFTFTSVMVLSYRIGKVLQKSTIVG